MSGNWWLAALRRSTGSLKWGEINPPAPVMSLHQYVAIFEWTYKVKRATPEFLRVRLAIRRRTNCPT
jgi:hypothetical protein